MENLNYLYSNLELYLLTIIFIDIIMYWYKNMHKYAYLTANVIYSYIQTYCKRKKKEKEKMDKKMLKLIGLIASLISTVAILADCGLNPEGVIGDILIVIWIIGLIVGYILGGGLKGAIGSAWKLAKFGWLIVPFPYDIMTGCITFVCAIMVFMLCPVIFVFLSFIKGEEQVS